MTKHIQTTSSSNEVHSLSVAKANALAAIETYFSDPELNNATLPCQLNIYTAKHTTTKNAFKTSVTRDLTITFSIVKE